MKSGMSVTVDKTKEIMAALRAATKQDVYVGIPMEANKEHGDGIDNATIGYINEYGSELSNIPPRPHLVPGVQKVSEECAGLMARGVSDALSGTVGATERGMNQAGLKAQASVRDTITRGEGFEPLADATLKNRERKGFTGTKPLIWTGQYRNSITYVVRAKK